MSPDLDAAILKMLQEAALAWSPLDFGRLTAAEEKAVFLLTAAGMIERRIALRLRLTGAEERIEATIIATGENGLGQAMEGVIAEAWGLWEEAFRSRKGDPDGAPPAFECVRTRTEEMRLTDMGAEFAAEVKAGERRPVLDFVHKTGTYGPSSPFILRNPANFIPGVGRKPVLGHGRLESIEVRRGGPQEVRVANLDEVAVPLKELTGLIRREFERRASEDKARDAHDGDVQRGSAKAGSEKSDSLADWRGVQKRLHEMVKAGEAFTSRRDLAARLGCSTATIQKALKRHPALRKWSARKRAARIARAKSLTHDMHDVLEQSREADPAEKAADKKAAADAALWAKILDQATPEERADLHTRSPEEIEQLIETMRNDPDRGDRILKRKA